MDQMPMCNANGLICADEHRLISISEQLQSFAFPSAHCFGFTVQKAAADGETAQISLCALPTRHRPNQGVHHNHVISLVLPTSSTSSSQDCTNCTQHLLHSVGFIVPVRAGHLTSAIISIGLYSLVTS